MGPTAWRKRAAAASLAVAAIAATAVLLGSTSAATGAADPSLVAVGAAHQFLATYVADDGRVSRLDQGHDTVSEGQAYALLLAAGVGDEARFHEVWTWTASHLQRADGLFSWRWQEGKVTDAGAASDADLLIAWALGLGGSRFDDEALTREAKRVAGSVLALETVPVEAGRMLVAGPWATADAVVNPSYLVTRAMSQLWWITGDSRWAGVAAAARGALAADVATSPHLPSDWSTIDGHPTAAPDSTAPQFGYDAARVLVQMATDCDPSGRATAARTWPFFDDLGTDEIVAVFSLSGDALTSARHPVALVAAASAADAAGDERAASQLLDSAAQLDSRYPTYYGSAWIALTRLWLDTSMLGTCP